MVPPRAAARAGWAVNEAEPAPGDELWWPELARSSDKEEAPEHGRQAVASVVGDEVGVAVRAWERAQRLEREQRGAEA